MVRKINRVGKDVVAAISGVQEEGSAPIEEIKNDKRASAEAEEEAIQPKVMKFSEIALPIKVQQIMREHKLKKETRGVRIDLDEDLHTELKILCIRMGKTQEDFLKELITNAVKKKA